MGNTMADETPPDSAPTVRTPTSGSLEAVAAVMAAAQALAAATDAVTFRRLWTAVGELARSGSFDFDPADAEPKTPAPKAPSQKESNDHDQ